MRRSRSWKSVTKTRVGPNDARAKDSKRHRELKKEMLLQRRPRGADWVNSTDCKSVAKGASNATNRKNTDANDKAYGLNQKSFQALDALAMEYADFEATMANVTSEHEVGDVLHAATLEVAEELERTWKDHHGTIWTAPAMQ